ncbi:5'-nucleotidase C-terminal domain-containing protein [Natrinema sp. 74]|uniref:5'-nucleotidase C-terminal domain-containing protein n=1 Tax=Natrinema sp. 74 TaxID=3384159 RepID=UPI0038D50005
MSNNLQSDTFLAAVTTLVLVVSSVAAVAPAGAMTQPQTVSIQEIQRPNGSSGSSPYAGTNVTTTGTVTGVTAERYYIQNGTGHYSGVSVYTGSQPQFEPGDVVEVTAPVKEFHDQTELDATVSSARQTKTGTASVPAAADLDTGSVGQEAYEGVLVEVHNATVTATPGQYGEWAVDDSSGDIAVDDVSAGDAATPNETGGTVDTLRGPVSYSFGTYKIQPKHVGTTTPPSDDGSSDDGTPTDSTTLTVLSYNDLQTAASNPNATGRLVGAVNERRAAHTNPTVVVGGGDQVSPSSLSPVSNWTVPVATTNVADPAADVVGNHDLDYGFAAVEEYTNASEYPWLLANVRHEDGGSVPGTQNYTIVERDGVKIGIVGLVDEAIKSKTAVDFDANGYRVADYSTVGSEIATKLKEENGVDVVIAAAHIGVPGSKELARETEHIDVIVTGDDEVAYSPQKTDETVIMEAEGRAAYLGELNLTVSKNGSVAMQDGRLLTVADNGDIPINETAHSIVADARSESLLRVIGKTESRLNSTFAANYHDETAWGNVITDAFRNQTGAEVAITNAGGIRGNFVIDRGNVTYDDVYTSLPFGNTLVTKRLNGTELTNLLESQVVTLDSDTGQQHGAEASLQVSGVTYEFVPHEGAEPIIRDVSVGGEPLQANATYNVTVNSYMAGWDDLADEPMVSQEYTLYGTAVAKYIEAKGTIAPEDTNRIRRVDREVGAEWLFPGGGKQIPIHYEVPDTVDSVNASTVQIENATTGTLQAERVTFTGDDLVMYFDREAFATLATGSTDLQVYAKYNDSVYDSQFVYFDNAVLNGDLENWQRYADDGRDEDDDRCGPPWAGAGDEDHGPPWADDEDDRRPPRSSGE